MEQKKPSIFELAKPVPAPTENQAFDNALHAVQTYLNMIRNDEDKISEFNDMVNSFCWEAKKSK